MADDVASRYDLDTLRGEFERWKHEVNDPRYHEIHVRLEKVETSVINIAEDVQKMVLSNDISARASNRVNALVDKAQSSKLTKVALVAAFGGPIMACATLGWLVFEAVVYHVR